MIFLPDMASLHISGSSLDTDIEKGIPDRLEIKAYVRSCDLFSSKEHSQIVGDAYRTALDSLLEGRHVDLTLAFPFRDEVEYWMDTSARSFTLGFVGGALKDPERVRCLITDMARKTSRRHGATLFHACRTEIENLGHREIVNPDVFRTTLSVWDVYRRGKSSS